MFSAEVVFLKFSGFDQADYSWKIKVEMLLF